MDVFFEFLLCECFYFEENKWIFIVLLLGNCFQYVGVVFENVLYIFGGFQDVDEEFFMSFYRYDLDLDSWMELVLMFLLRVDYIMFVYWGNIYVVGGWYENVNQQWIMVVDLDCYDYVIDSWEILIIILDFCLYVSYMIMD